jgi:hypothetical protein
MNLLTKLLRLVGLLLPHLKKKIISLKKFGQRQWHKAGVSKKTKKLIEQRK